MKISEIARGTGLTKDTVRLYERLGLLVDISRPFPSNNYKDYRHPTHQATATSGL